MIFYLLHGCWTWTVAISGNGLIFFVAILRVFIFYFFPPPTLSLGLIYDASLNSHKKQGTIIYIRVFTTNMSKH